MKSTTYIVEITTQNDEKNLSEGRNPLACLPARFVWRAKGLFNTKFKNKTKLKKIIKAKKIILS